MNERQALEYAVRVLEAHAGQYYDTPSNTERKMEGYRGAIVALKLAAKIDEYRMLLHVPIDEPGDRG